MDNPEEHSEFFPHAAISRVNRYKALAKNVRVRRGTKSFTNIPVYDDINTADPFLTLVKSKESKEAAKENCIFMDSAIAGMGSTAAFQITQQASCLDECLKLYDQLVPLTPIMMAMTASSPAFYGVLADTDNRMPAYNQALDDRTAAELKIPNFKPRTGPVNCYLSGANEQFNDVAFQTNVKLENLMLRQGVPATLAKHLAFVFNFDPLVLYSGKIFVDDVADQSLFENINSSVWQSLRLKPPVESTDCWWRVEFRTMSVQPTEFENAAFGIFIVLLSRAILK